MGLTRVFVDKVKDLITFCRPKKQGSGKHPFEINNYSTQSTMKFSWVINQNVMKNRAFFELVNIWWRTLSQFQFVYYA